MNRNLRGNSLVTSIRSQRAARVFFRATRKLAPLVICGVLVGCGPKPAVFTAPYDNSGLVVTAEKTEFDNEDLKLKLQLVNHTGQLMVIDMNQIVLRLPEGQTIQRKKVTWGGWGVAAVLPQQRYITPGMSDVIDIAFEVNRSFTQAAVVFGGVVVDNHPLALPDYPLTIMNGKDSNPVAQR